MSETKKLAEVFQKEVKRISKQLDKEPGDLSKAEFVKSSEKLSDWELRKLGGYASALGTYFERTDDLVYKTGSSIIRAFKSKLVKKQATDDYLTEEFLNVFKENLKTTTIKVHQPVKSKKNIKLKNRAIVAHISDTHFGANINIDEMGKVNQFNWTVAARRMALFAKQVVEYKEQHRDNTKLVVCINGDIIAGVIHNQEWFCDLLTTQFEGTIQILSQFISYCARYFDNVEVHCSPGNHSRAMHKMSKQRAMTHKWDSYENMIYLALKEVLKAKHSNIKVNVPKTPYAIIEVLGHRGFMTHGDTVLNVGNPGKSINMKSINMQINSLNASTLADKKFDFIMCGHVHVSTVQIADNGTTVLINGTLSGADPFCQSIGIFSNEPSQTLFEVTEDHPVGDIRMIKLVNADKDESLDKIIEPPQLSQ